MATRRRDIAPGKHTATTQLKPNPNPNLPSKTNSTAQNHELISSRKNTPIRARPVSLGPTSNLHNKQHPTKVLDKTPLLSRKTNDSTNPPKPSTWARDKTPLPAQKRQVQPSNPPTKARDKTPLPAQNPPTGARDKTPLPARKRQVPINSLRSRDNTPKPERKMQVPTNNNTSIKPRDKTPLPKRQSLVPTNSASRPRDKTPAPARKKTQVPATNQPSRSRDRTPLRKANAPKNPSPRLSSIPEKNNSASQKRGPSKNPKPLSKDAEKLHSSSVEPVSSTLNMKEQENEKSDSSSEKEVIADGQQAKVEIPDMYENVPEVELLLEDQESFTLLEGEKQIAKIPREDEEGTIDLMPVEQEKPLDLALVDKENDKDDDNSDAKEDDKIVTDEPSPVEEQEEAPLDVKPQELEEKLCAEEKSEEQNLHEIDNSNDVVESVAESYLKEDNEEREVQTEEAEVVEKEEEEEEEEEEKEKEKVPDKKDEVASEGEAVIEPIKKDEVASEGEAVIEPIEIKEQVVEKKKQEPENVPSQAKEQEVVEKNKQEQENQAAQKQVVPRKRDSVVSNDMIEETANKLREQRKNRVRALAGAFESVISSQ